MRWSTVYNKAALTLGILALACSQDSPERGGEVREVQREANLADAEWVALTQGDGEVGDPDSDGANNGREVIGGPGLPAVFIYSDGVDFGLRLRVDEDPTNGSPPRRPRHRPPRSSCSGSTTSTAHSSRRPVPEGGSVRPARRSSEASSTSRRTCARCAPPTRTRCSSRPAT
jgi:hypothetical protein